MNVIDGDSLLVTMAVWIAVAIALAVTATYLLRPKARDRYPGGRGRYIAALVVQAAGFMVPIPFVLLFLLGAPIWPGFDVLIAVASGVVVVVLLRFLPVTGPLLRDLHKLRLELALERMQR